MDLTANFKDILKEITSKYYTKWHTKTFGDLNEIDDFLEKLKSK